MKSNNDKSTDNNNSARRPVTKVDAGRQYTNPIDYDHPWPSMLQFAQLLTLRYDCNRTRKLAPDLGQSPLPDPHQPPPPPAHDEDRQAGTRPGRSPWHTHQRPRTTVPTQHRGHPHTGKIRAFAPLLEHLGAKIATDPRPHPRRTRATTGPRAITGRRQNTKRIRRRSVRRTGLVQLSVQSKGSFLAFATPFIVRRPLTCPPSLALEEGR